MATMDDADDGPSSKGVRTPRRNNHNRRIGGGRQPVSDQRFSSYMTFGFHATVCLAIFLFLYIILLVGLFPLLNQDAPNAIPTRRGEVLSPVLHNAVEKFQHMPHYIPVGQHMAENVVLTIKKNISDLRKTEGVTDASLMKKAVEEFEALKLQRQQRQPGGVGAGGVRGGGIPAPGSAGAVGAVVPVPVVPQAKPAPGRRPGFIVLGMHRSGTSMLAGLMVTGMGYKTGGPLIGGAFDNEKGFFELIAAVLQNDEFMRLQRVWWAANVLNYDSQKALTDLKEKKLSFEEGNKALAVLNNPANVPYLQKDPRMCITLKTWLPLLAPGGEPAIVFTYRHPLEVALSLKKRENNFSLEHGLRLWINYNMRAIQNSDGLCRVLSSNEAILADPLHEIQRISNELTNTCGVPAPERELQEDDVAKFIDPNLQHNKKEREAEDAKKPIVAEHGDCKVRDYVSDLAAGSVQQVLERKVYLAAMKIYCDFQSGEAYKTGYQWPDVFH